MYPFFDLFGKDIPMYGVMCVLAAFVAAGFASSRAKKYAVDTRDVVYMCIFAIIGAIIGAKALAVVTFLIQAALHRSEIVEAGFGLWDVIYGAFAGTGIVFFGGLIGGTIGGLVYLRMYKLSVPVFVDVAAPCIPIAHAIGRVGCFLAGCCYGVESAWGLEFNNSPAAPAHIKLLPIQLIESDVNLLIAAIILIYERIRNTCNECEHSSHAVHANKNNGKNLLVYLILYSISRFVLEFWRGDAVRGVYLGVSTSQIISVLIFIAAICLFLFYTRQGAKNLWMSNR